MALAIRMARGVGRNVRNVRAISQSLVRFSSSNGNGNDETECQGMNSLPCLKRDPTLPKLPQNNDQQKCKKICMPCCLPAKDPPSCVKKLGRKKCTPPQPPYPSYSQCMKPPQPSIDCECRPLKPPPCDVDSKKKESSQTKRC